MGYIKEPEGVDFIVDPTPLTIEERKRISEIIAHYKATGKKLPFQKLKPSRKKKDTRPSKTIKNGGRNKTLFVD
jgi:hypothetical protein